MSNINIVHANKNHKEFIIHANNVINNVNDTKQTNGLEANIEKIRFKNYITC